MCFSLFAGRVHEVGAAEVGEVTVLLWVIMGLLGGGFLAEPGGPGSATHGSCSIPQRTVGAGVPSEHEARLGTRAGWHVMVCVPGVWVCSTRWATSRLTLTSEEREKRELTGGALFPPPHWRGLSVHTHAPSRVARACGLPTAWEQLRPAGSRVSWG